MIHDFIVIGGGIVGASTAWQLMQRRPGLRVLLIDKEAAPATHQSGHTSGVIHAGVYYAPGSLKAGFCRQGVETTLRFCEAHGIAFEQCGKLIVATSDAERGRLEQLFARARENRIEVQMLSGAALREREPRITGTGAMFVRSTGIVDFRQVTRAMIGAFEALGGEARFGVEAIGITERQDEVVVHTPRGELRCGFLVCCAGLMADRLARMSGLPPAFRIVPFRGEFFRLGPDKDALIRHLVYPVPDPALPFLGVHLTRLIGGGVIAGPNAVLALAREGYRWSDVSPRDVAGMLAFPGFWRLAIAHAGAGLAGIRNSIRKRDYLTRLQRYCPELSVADLRPHPAGVRAQAVDRDGRPVDDFLVLDTARSLHVCNAPSPAATSAIPIGAHLVDRITARHRWD
jgi:L-2-hydroxyglutarate oxidase